MYLLLFSAYFLFTTKKEKKASIHKEHLLMEKESGDDLLFRHPAVQVPLAHKSLTSEFGMGSGVASKV